MAMDFWQSQRKARKRTFFFLIIFIVLTLLVATASEIAMRVLAQENYQEDFPLVALAFIGITFCVALFQYTLFKSQGGSYVAESMGGILLTKESAYPKEAVLLNIVEEIALASSLPVPKVYLINANEINAFAAGLNPNDAVIAVTVGSLEKLNRDELQGVIAHEFGHIANADMLIGMRLAAMVMGFYFVLYIAIRMMQVSGIRGNRNESQGKGNGGNVLALAAIILVVAGAFMWLAGSILKSMVSRQREYLADASSAQFTRNPAALADALKKIATLNVHDMPKSGIAFSHLYFSESSLLSALFATHPPIKDRIKALLE